MCECAYINRVLNIPLVLNMLKFGIRQSSEYGTVLNMSALYSIMDVPRICLGRLLNISWVLNMLGFLMY